MQDGVLKTHHIYSIRVPLNAQNLQDFNGISIFAPKIVSTQIYLYAWSENNPGRSHLTNFPNTEPKYIIWGSLNAHSFIMLVYTVVMI